MPQARESVDWARATAVASEDFLQVFMEQLMVLLGGLNRPGKGMRCPAEQREGCIMHRYRWRYAASKHAQPFQRRTYYNSSAAAAAFVVKVESDLLLD